MKSFKELKCWSEARDLYLVVHTLTDVNPELRKKLWHLIDQMLRSALSISSNIAEGWGRKSDTQFAHFLDISLGSLAELESQASIFAKIVSIGETEEEIVQKASSVRRLIVGLKHSLRLPKKPA